MTWRWYPELLQHCCSQPNPQIQPHQQPHPTTLAADHMFPSSPSLPAHAQHPHLRDGHLPSPLLWPLNLCAPHLPSSAHAHNLLQQPDGGGGSHIDAQHPARAVSVPEHGKAIRIRGVQVSVASWWYAQYGDVHNCSFRPRFLLVRQPQDLNVTSLKYEYKAICAAACVLALFIP